MKSLILTAVSLASMAAAATNGTKTQYPKVAPAVDVKVPTATPWLFQLQATDTTWLGLVNGSDGAYLFPGPSQYAFYLNGTTLFSTSGDIFSSFTDDSLGAYFVQPDVEGGDLQPLACKTTGKYPALQLACKLGKGKSFGDYYGSLLFGQGPEVYETGATLVHFVVYPACDYPGSVQE